MFYETIEKMTNLSIKNLGVDAFLPNPDSFQPYFLYVRFELWWSTLANKTKEIISKYLQKDEIYSTSNN